MSLNIQDGVTQREGSVTTLVENPCNKVNKGTIITKVMGHIFQDEWGGIIIAYIAYGLLMAIEIGIGINKGNMQ